MGRYSSDYSLEALQAAFAQPGRVVWLGVRPMPRASMRVVNSVLAIPGHGLEGDHFAGRPGSARQLTLVQAEHLPVIASFLGMAEIEPTQLRRNIAVQGVNLLALKGRRCRVGPVVLDISGRCQPCSRMEEELGFGGYNAVRGHGGVTARIITGGVVRVGDVVDPAEASDQR